MRPQLIVLAGAKGTGKDTVADYVAKHYGYTHVSPSDWLRRYLREQGITTPTGRQLREAGYRLRAEDPNQIEERAIDGVTGPIVLSGIRDEPTIDWTLARGGTIWRIVSEEEDRRLRVEARARPGDEAAQTWQLPEVWIAALPDDKRAAVERVQSRLAAEATEVSNRGTITELHQEIDRLMSRYEPL